MIASGEKILVRMRKIGIRKAYVFGTCLVRIAGQKNTRVDYKLVITTRNLNYDGDVLASNEGITWCRGWDGRVADAFRVSCALAGEDVLDT